MNMQETKPISAYKQGLRSKIIETALKAFRARGIRAVTMDDVATELKISKRTLYEIFSNKEEVLSECVIKYFEDRRLNMEVQIAHCKNVMEIVMVFFRKKIDEIRHTNPQFYADLAQYPQLADYLKDQKERIRTESAKFFERGRQEGYFREEFNPELVTMLFEALNKFVMENRLYQQYSFEEIFKNLAVLTLRGICTDKGLKLLDKLL
jgi:AcrR family transcriptional regulator